MLLLVYSKASIDETRGKLRRKEEEEWRVLLLDKHWALLAFYIVPGTAIVESMPNEYFNPVRLASNTVENVRSDFTELQLSAS